jgi:CDP-4-dehydro-6-deoxyglucose reductase, E1
MTQYNIGDIYIYSVPFTDKIHEKPRPVVIVSEPNSKGDLTIISGTTQGHSWNEKWLCYVSTDEVEGNVLKEDTVFPISKQSLIPPKFFKQKLGRLKNEKLKELLKKISLRQTDIYFNSIHKPSQTETFIPGQSRIPYAGRVFDQNEMINLIDSSLDFWLTSGSYTEKFERAFAKKIGVKYCSVVNSGSSANLVAFMALTSPRLGERRICKGDEVITLAAGFPTTINPIIQYGAIPVFVDVTIPTYNIDVSMLEEALSEKTKAVMIAHTLGNPFDLAAVKDFCVKNNLWLVEDNCDALGSLYQNQMTGSFGDIATSSFYPPHHITMGEGGAVYTNNSRLKVAMDSFRDWGRDCYCPSGKDNTCKKRFKWQLGTLPEGYDHKYIYSHFGYNLKATDMQAAIGCAQLEKLDRFSEARRKNWQTLYEGLKDLEEHFILPEATLHTDPSWFGFLLTLKDTQRFTRDDIVQFLESQSIQTRMLFAGNMIRHPAFDQMREKKEGYRIVGNLNNTDTIMNYSFWLGVYPGMSENMITFMIENIHKFFDSLT